MSRDNTIMKVYKNAKKIPFDDTTRIVIMSDVHRSDGSGSDNFIHNQNIAIVALNHYYNENYTYIELGDGDELWENKDFKCISTINNKIFYILNRFLRKNRLFMIYGNHDMIKKKENWVKKNMVNGVSECYNQNIELFHDIKIYEGIVLNHTKTENTIFLLHGHQVEIFSYDLWRLSRFLVRYLWRPLELIGINDPTNPCNNKKNKLDKTLDTWAKNNNVLVIAGHTHRVAFPEIEEKSNYFNDGCCIYPYYITVIEIANNEISLVKWSIQTKKDGTLYVDRTVLKKPRKISGYFSENNDN